MDSRKEALCGGRGGGEHRGVGRHGSRRQGSLQTQGDGRGGAPFSHFPQRAQEAPSPRDRLPPQLCLPQGFLLCPGRHSRPYHVKSKPSSLRGCLWSTCYIGMVLGSAQPGPVAETEKRARFWVGGWGVIGAHRTGTPPSPGPGQPPGQGGSCMVLPGNGAGGAGRGHATLCKQHVYSREDSGKCKRFTGQGHRAQGLAGGARGGRGRC